MQTPQIFFPVRFDKCMEITRWISDLVSVREEFRGLNFGVEININFYDTIDLGRILAEAEILRENAVREGFCCSVHLPGLNRLEDGDLNNLAGWLRDLSPGYAVIHGCDFPGACDDDGISEISSREFLGFFSQCRARLSLLGKCGVELLVENVPPVRIKKAGKVFTPESYMVYCAGIFAKDLRELIKGTDCGVIFDTEHMFQSAETVSRECIFNYRDASQYRDEYEVECVEKTGFIVREGFPLLFAGRAEDCSFKKQMDSIGPERFHITGSNSLVEGGKVTAHSEFSNDPFCSYLLSLVLARRPKSITIESCYENGIFDYDIQIRSLKSLSSMVQRYQLGGVEAN